MDTPLADGIEAPPQPAQASSICFIVDPDFGFLQGFSRSLRRIGIDTVDLITSARLAENVDAQHPDIIFIDLDPVHPTECARALVALRECRFTGRIQLFGRSKLPLLEEFRRLGSDLALNMLPVMQKPIDFALVEKIVAEQQLKCADVAPAELSLRTALDQSYLTFRYQPKIDLQKRQVIGAEAFARIAHPRHGILSPARFMAGATGEDRLELAHCALINALDMSARFDQLGIALQMAINLSVEAIMTLPVADLVAKHRPANEAWPGILFEVPETQVINRITVLRERLQEIAKCGASLSVDNCGRGNSSFAMFRYLPFSEIKIDPSFVQGCAGNKGNLNVCRSMIQLAHNFSRHAAAVGIETAEDAKELADVGCDLAQGYVFGKPMTDQQLMAMVVAGRAQSASFCNSGVWDVSTPAASAASAGRSQEFRGRAS
jgi:EAL domain-containing protein (putative c-di-GMP-specific phosphodiesterase class I)